MFLVSFPEHDCSIANSSEKNDRDTIAVSETIHHLFASL